MKKTSQDDIQQALFRVMHPEIDYSLVDLGMLRDIAFKEKEVTVTLKLPFLGVPIKDYLIQLVERAVKDVDKTIKVRINIKEMSSQERQEFMKKAKEGWKL